MPQSLKLARDYGDDLGLLFVAGGKETPDQIEEFAWKHKWMGTTAMWSKERPFNTGATTIPNCALLSASGEVLVMGNPMRLHREIVDLIEQEIENAKNGPEGSPKSLKKAWKAFAKGDLAKAIKAAEAVAEKGGEDAEDATAAVKLFRDKIKAQTKRFEWLMKNGYVLEADELASSLAKATKGLDEETVADVAKLSEALGAEGMADEMKAAKSFAKLEERAFEDGLEEGNVKKLRKFAEKHEGTFAGKRAQRLVTLSGL